MDSFHCQPETEQATCSALCKDSRVSMKFTVVLSAGKFMSTIVWDMVELDWVVCSLSFTNCQ